MNIITITKIGIENGVTENTKYHDDMYDERVVIEEFRYKYLFGDFRMFEGVKLSELDNLLVNISLYFDKLYKIIKLSGGTRLGCGEK